MQADLGLWKKSVCQVQSKPINPQKHRSTTRPCRRQLRMETQDSSATTTCGGQRRTRTRRRRRSDGRALRCALSRCSARDRRCLERLAQRDAWWAAHHDDRRVLLRHDPGARAVARCWVAAQAHGVSSHRNRALWNDGSRREHRHRCHVVHRSGCNRARDDRLDVRNCRCRSRSSALSLGASLAMPISRITY